MNVTSPDGWSNSELWSSDPHVKHEALNRLYVAMKSTMYGVAKQTLRDSPDVGSAEDAVHDAFERFMRASDHLPPDTDVKSYLVQTVRNRCLDIRRKKRPQVCESPELTNGKIVGAITQCPVVEAAMLRELLGRLNPDDRMAITLRWIHELPPAECANAMEMPLNNYNVRLHRAMVKLTDLANQQTKECLE